MEIGISQDVRGVVDMTVVPELKIYRVNGPLELVRWLRRYGGTCVGEISEPEPLTIASSERVELGIPLSAEYVSFLYPPCMSGAKLCTDSAHSLLTYGGFVYFDAPDRRLSRNRMITELIQSGGDELHCVQINACIINPDNEASRIILDGPYELPESSRKDIFEKCLLHPASESLIDRQSRYVTWMGTKGDLPSCAYGVLCYSTSDDPADCEMVHYRLVHEADESNVGFGGVGAVVSPTRSSKKYLNTVNHERKLSGNYNILAVLGKGSFATVYSAVHLTTGEMVALKVIKTRADDGLIQQTMKEHIIMKSLVHRNLVKIHAFEIHPNSVHLIMDYVEGTNLKNLIENTWKGKLPLTILVRLLREIIQAVGYLHSKEVIHRDLKPANVMCTSRGGVKVVDFGTAHQLSVDDSECTWQGTPAYSSPESLTGTIAKPQDVWAIGCIALEMATGTQPWSHLGDVHRARLLKMIMQSEHPIPEDLSPQVKDFIKSCMQADPTKRPDCSTLLTHEFILTDDEELVELDETSGRRRTTTQLLQADSESYHGDTCSELIETTSWFGGQNQSHIHRRQLSVRVPSNVSGRSLLVSGKSKFFGDTHSSFGASPVPSPVANRNKIVMEEIQSIPFPRQQSSFTSPNNASSSRSLNHISGIPTTSSSICYMKEVKLPRFMDAIVRRVLHDRPVDLLSITKCVSQLCGEMSTQIEVQDPTRDEIPPHNTNGGDPTCSDYVVAAAEVGSNCAT